MQTTHSLRNRVLTASAGAAIATGVAFGGFVLSGAATAAPDAPTSTANLPSCAELVNPDGTEKLNHGVDACLPVDVFNDKDLTLAQRIAFVNPDSPRHDQIVAQLKAEFGK